MVAGSKGIKHHVGVWQQVLPVSRGQSDRVSEHFERIRLGQLCNGLKTAKRNQPVHQYVGLALAARSQRPQCRRCQNRADDFAGVSMSGWIGLEQQTWNPPRLLLAEITQTSPGRR